MQWATYTTTLTLSQVILNQTGKLLNSVDFIGSFTTPGGISGIVTETSDDNDDTDGNVVDDPTETLLSNTAGIKLTKTFSINDKNANGLNRCRGYNHLLAECFKYRKCGSVIIICY